MSKKDTQFYFPNRYVKARPFVGKLYDKVGSLIGKNEAKASEIIDETFELEFSRKAKETGEYYNLSQHLADKYDNEFYSFKTFMLWKFFGMNIFSFSYELLDLLAHTDVDDVRYSDIKYPYRHFYLSFRELGADIDNTFYNLKNGLDGAYIEFYDRPTEDNAWLSISICGFHKENSDKILKDWLNTPEYQMRFGLGFKKKEQTIKEALDFLLDQMKVSNEVEPELILDSINFLKKYLNLIVNCLCYLSLETRKIDKNLPSDTPQHLTDKINKAESKHQKEIAAQEIKRLNYTYINFVGEEFRKNETIKGDASIGLSPHFRRGHFRRQKHGVGLSETKIIWIKPTIVRPDKGNPTHGHIYNVENEKDTPSV